MIALPVSFICGGLLSGFGPLGLLTTCFIYCLLMGTPGFLLMGIAGLTFLALLFLFTATGRYRISLAMLRSLGWALVALLTVAAIGERLFIILQHPLTNIGLLPSRNIESAGWIGIFAVSILSNLAGMGVFVISLVRYARRPASRRAGARGASADTHVEIAPRYVLIAGTLCVAGILYGVYHFTPRLHTSASLAARLVKRSPSHLADGAYRELRRRGAVAAPALVAAIEQAPDSVRNPRPRDDNLPLAVTLQLLNEANTEEAREAMRLWVRRADAAPYFRAVVAKSLLDAGDVACVPLLDDLLRDKGDKGQTIRTMLFRCFTGPEWAGAVPYLSTAVDDTLITDLNPPPELLNVCISALVRIDTEDAWAVLARIARHSEYFRERVERKTSRERLNAALTEAPGPGQGQSRPQPELDGESQRWFPSAYPVHRRGRGN